MTRLNAFMSMLLGGLALFVGLQPGGVQASTTQPCISVAINASNFNFIPVNGGGQTYCQSAFGWSDTWFPTTQPSTYNQHLDALSGDNSPSHTGRTKKRRMNRPAMATATATAHTATNPR